MRKYYSAKLLTVPYAILISSLSDVITTCSNKKVTQVIYILGNSDMYAVYVNSLE
jgi:hypothetical protein